MCTHKRWRSTKTTPEPRYIIIPVDYTHETKKYISARARADGSGSREQNALNTPCRATTASLSHTFIVINIHAIRHSGEISTHVHITEISLDSTEEIARVVEIRHKQNE